MTEQAQPPVRIWYRITDYSVCHDRPDDLDPCDIEYTLTSTIPANMLEAQQRIMALEEVIREAIDSLADCGGTLHGIARFEGSQRWMEYSETAKEVGLRCARILEARAAIEDKEGR